MIELALILETRFNWTRFDSFSTIRCRRDRIKHMEWQLLKLCFKFLTVTSKRLITKIFKPDDATSNAFFEVQIEEILWAQRFGLLGKVSLDDVLSSDVYLLGNDWRQLPKRSLSTYTTPPYVDGKDWITDYHYRGRLLTMCQHTHTHNHFQWHRRPHSTVHRIHP